MSRRTAVVLAGAALSITPLLFNAPAHAVSVVGNSSFGSAATGSGFNGGTLGAGSSFSIDVTGFFSGLGTEPFNSTKFGVGIVKAPGSQVSFSKIGAKVKGIAGGTPFDGNIAIWGGPGTSVVNNAFVTIGTGPDSAFPGAPAFYLAADQNLDPDPLNPKAYREISFTLDSLLPSGFGSGKATPFIIGLTQVDKFEIIGTLDSVTGPDTIISFGVGPAGTPVAGQTFGAYFSASASPVPGPLPILGAGVAFGWSRTLRRRIQDAKQREATAV